MRLERGGSVIFRPAAKAWEMVPETVRDEFRRRVRIGAGDAHALRHTWRLLLPTQGMLAVSYWSHKIVRWIGPVLLLTAFVANLWLADRPWGRVLLIAQVAVYALGLAALWLRSVPVIGRLATGVWYFMTDAEVRAITRNSFRCGSSPTSVTSQHLAGLSAPTIVSQQLVGTHYLSHVSLCHRTRIIGT